MTGTAAPNVFHGKGYNTACLSSPGSATPITFQDKGDYTLMVYEDQVVLHYVVFQDMHRLLFLKGGAALSVS